MKKISVIHRLLFLAVLFQIFSCIPLKDVKYIQPDSKLELDENGLVLENRPTYYIQKNDNILIKVAAKDESMLGILRDFTNKANQQGGSYINKSNQGVRVKLDGNIELPRLGNIKIEGLTLEEAREVIKEKFYSIYKPDAAFIDVAMPGINFTIVGEVSSGNYFIDKHDFNLLEAFAMAGNLSDVADRKHIRILRNTPKGTVQAEVDITQESVMNSEFFWLQPNDLIIVNPRRQKQWGIGINPISTITTVFGAITAMFGMYFFFDRL